MWKNRMIEAMELQLYEIQSLIYEIRGHKVMFDFDLAEMYGVETRRLKEQVKRNSERFPDDFMFQLSKSEWRELVANCDKLPVSIGHSPVTPLRQEHFMRLQGRMTCVGKPRSPLLKIFLKLNKIHILYLFAYQVALSAHKFNSLKTVYDFTILLHG